VLLSLFPNGLLPDGQMNSFHEGDVYPVDYDPASLQYMLHFFRDVAQSIPSTSPSPTTPPENDPISIEPLQGSTKDMLHDRAGIIVLREDLDFYVIPPRADIEALEMTEVKRAAGKSLLQQNGIFSGLKRSEETGTTEQHLIEMLTAGGSIMMIYGAIGQENRTKPSFVVWRLPDCGRMSEAMLRGVTPWAWRRSCYSSGGSPLGDVGGKVWSSTMLKELKEI